MSDRYDYPEEICAYCEYTAWGTGSYPFHGPNGTECDRDIVTGKQGDLS